jgi:hypothetical protein
MMVLESEKDIYSDLENLLESDFFLLNFVIKIHTERLLSLEYKRLSRALLKCWLTQHVTTIFLADWAFDKIVSR